MKRKVLLYFGPLTICIEWIGLLLGSLFVHEFNFDQPISIASVNTAPLPLIFAITLFLASISYFIFSFALYSFSKYAPIVAFLAGAALSLTGIIPFKGDGGVSDTLHSICIQIAIAGYCLLVWLMRTHPVRSVRKITSTALLGLLTLNLGAVLSIFILHKYAALLQLSMLLVIQIWTLVIVWHSRPLK